VDEPLTTIEPVTAPPAEGLAPELAAALLAGAVVGAVLDAGAVVAPLPPQAAATSTDANASVATRQVANGCLEALDPTMVVLLFGRGPGGMPVRLLWNVSRTTVAGRGEPTVCGVSTLR
jgi:hypothetical protein